MQLTVFVQQLLCHCTVRVSRSRISSTVIASLVCAVPIIADTALLEAYGFLTEEHVFLRGNNEDEAAAMYRVAQMPEAEVFARRHALVALRQKMDERMDGVFRELLRPI